MAKLLDGRVVRRHTDHLRMRTIELEKLAQEETRDDTYLEFDSDDGTDPRRPTEQGNSPEMSRSETHQRETELRYPSRVHRQPDRYDPS